MGDIFRSALATIEEAKNNKDSGIYNTIPFGLPSLDKHVPGVMKNLFYLISAGSGIGKTMVTKFLFVNQPYKFIKENPQLGLKLKIMYFALEESKEEFMMTLISHRLKEKYSISIGVLELRSIGNYTLSNDILDKIKECEEYFSELENSLEIIDSVFNPYGIFQHVRSYATNNGTHHYKDHTFNHTHENGNVVSESKKIYSHYTPNDPKEFVIVIVDHASLLSIEQTPETNTLRGAIKKMSADYMRKMITKHYKYCAVLVQQQTADAQTEQYNYSGASIESKLTPKPEGLADNKTTFHDAMIFMTLFSPDRFGIERYMGYDITTLKDFFREIKIHKNRIGSPNLSLPLLFNGQTNSFNELPPIGSPELEKLYEIIRNYRRLKNQ